MARTPGGSGGGGSPFPRYSGTYSGGYQMQNLLSVAEFLVSNGYSRTAAAGIAGAIAGESSGDPEAVGSGGAGLIGWTPPSKAAPDNPIVTGSPQADFDAQLTDLLEYNNTNGPVRQLKTMSGDPVAASKFYSANFERPLVTYSDVRANVAQSVYQHLGGYQSDAAYTQYTGSPGGTQPIGKGQLSGNAGAGSEIHSWAARIYDDLNLGGGIFAGVSSASDVAGALTGLAAPFVKVAEAVDWFMQPNHWIRIFCGLGGGLLTVVGIWNLSHAGGQASSVTVMGSNVPTSLGGNLALPFGILEVGLGGVGLFVAFHNLPSSVATFPDFLAYLQGEVQKQHSKAPAPGTVAA